MGCSRQEYWSRLPCPPPGDLPEPGTEQVSFMFPALAGGSLLLAPPGKPPGHLVPKSNLGNPCRLLEEEPSLETATK